MRHREALAAFHVTFVIVSAISTGVQAQTEAPGLGPAGNLAAIEIEQAGEAILHGRDSRKQLLVTGRYSSGQLHDLTHSVTYSVAPTNVVQIDADGFVTPSDAEFFLLGKLEGRGTGASAGASGAGASEGNFGHQLD